MDKQQQNEVLAKMHEELSHAVKVLDGHSFEEVRREPRQIQFSTNPPIEVSAERVTYRMPWGDQADVELSVVVVPHGTYLRVFPVTSSTGDSDE